MESIANKNVEQRLAQMDKEIDRLNRLREAKLSMKRFYKVFILFFALFIAVLWTAQKNSAETVATIKSEIAKMPRSGNAIFNESGQMLGISYNEKENFDEYETIQP